MINYLVVNWFDTQIEAHTETQNTDVSLALKFQKYLSNASHKRVILDNADHKKGQVKRVDN